MGWKGTLRSIQAEIRRAEREAKRRERELQRQEKELARMRERERAEFEAERFENRVALLTSVHQDCGPDWDWNRIKNRRAPRKPSKSAGRESAALADLESYEPSFFDRFFRRAEKRTKSLEGKVAEAKRADDDAYRQATRAYEEAHAEWEQLTSLARGVLAGEPSAYLEAIEELEPFSDVTALGSEIRVEIASPRVIEATLNAHGDEVVPSERKSVLKSGKLSVKQMPKGQFFGIYQDYVCGGALRVARELIALLPVEMVVVHVVTDMLNSATGHMEEQPILSVAIPSATLEKLNLHAIDPSDSMKNFVHNMSFKKTKGFEPIEKFAVEQFVETDATGGSEG